MEDGTMLTGALCGFVAAGIIGFMMGQIRDARNVMRRRDLAMDEFADARQPGLTPYGIVRASCLAVFAYVGWVLALLLVLALFGYGAVQVLR